MTCRELIEFLMAYLDHELPPQQRAAFEAHLIECDDCVAYLDTYKETMRLGKSAFLDEECDAENQVPEELIAAVIAARGRSV
jgi:anti-sigma factor RsiW